MVQEQEIKTTETDEIKEIELPKEIQKSMLEFFMQTSIPRKKANNIKNMNNETLLSDETEER